MLNKIQERFESLTIREKFIVIATILVGLWSCWDSFFYRSLTAKKKLIDQQMISLNTQTSNLKQSGVELEKSGNINPNINNQNKLAELKTQYSRLQEQLLFTNKKFVPPELMAKALGDMLGQNDQLTLIKLESLPVSTLIPATQQFQPIYKHGLVIAFTGTYADTVHYLEALEELPWAIAWDNLDYQVKNYPIAEVTIRVFTLSFDKGWLGV